MNTEQCLWDSSDAGYIVALVAGIMQRFIDGGGQPKALTDLSQQQCPAIGGDISAGKFCLDPAAFQGGDSKAAWLQFVTGKTRFEYRLSN